MVTNAQLTKRPEVLRVAATTLLCLVIRHLVKFFCKGAFDFVWIDLYFLMRWTVFFAAYSSSFWLHELFNYNWQHHLESEDVFFGNLIGISCCDDTWNSSINNDSFLMKTFSIAVANHKVWGKLIQNWRKNFIKNTKFLIIIIIQTFKSWIFSDHSS